MVTNWIRKYVIEISADYAVARIFVARMTIRERGRQLNMTWMREVPDITRKRRKFRKADKQLDCVGKTLIYISNIPHNRFPGEYLDRCNEPCPKQRQNYFISGYHLEEVSNKSDDSS